MKKFILISVMVFTSFLLVILFLFALNGRYVVDKNMVFDKWKNEMFIPEFKNSIY